MVDAAVSKTVGIKPVGVRVSPSAPIFSRHNSGINHLPEI